MVLVVEFGDVYVPVLLLKLFELLGDELIGSDLELGTQLLTSLVEALGLGVIDLLESVHC